MLHTPALELGILAGVTRETLVAAAFGAGIRLAEGEYPRERLVGRGRGLRLVGVREVMPVVRLDGGETVGDGVPGPGRGADAGGAPPGPRATAP